MALLFTRVAKNFVKAGYFPTDAETMRRVLNALVPAEGEDRLRIIDPCCGEGVALAECKHHLGADRTEAFGIEYDEDRAWHAKQLLDHCIHGDLQDCVIGKRQYGHPLVCLKIAYRKKQVFNASSLCSISDTLKDPSKTRRRGSGRKVWCLSTP